MVSGNSNNVSKDDMNTPSSFERYSEGLAALGGEEKMDTAEIAQVINDMLGDKISVNEDLEDFKKAVEVYDLGESKDIKDLILKRINGALKETGITGNIDTDRGGDVSKAQIIRLILKSYVTIKTS